MQELPEKPAVYILAARRNGTLYIGSTTELRKRISHHGSGHGSRATTKHSVRMLVYYEFHPHNRSARTRERQLKKCNRAFKLALIEKHNPKWRDLYEDIV